MFKKDLLECLDYIETQDISKVKKALKECDFKEDVNKKTIDIIKSHIEHPHIRVVKEVK